jgi:hypothetical protein
MYPAAGRKRRSPRAEVSFNASRDRHSIPPTSHHPSLPAPPFSAPSIDNTTLIEYYSDRQGQCSFSHIGVNRETSDLIGNEEA